MGGFIRQGGIVMKARIKKTGEIVNLASYAVIALDTCDSWGNPIELKPEEVELIDENAKSIDFDSARMQIALEMAKFISKEAKLIKIKDLAARSVKFADALIEELKK